MEKYKILELKTDGEDHEIYGSVIAEVKIEQKNGNEFYVSLADVEGIPSFYKSDISLYGIHTGNDWENAAEVLNKYFLDVGDYDDVLSNHKDNLYDIYKYLIYSINLEGDDLNKFIEETTEKYLDEIIIPDIDLD